MQWELATSGTRILQRTRTRWHSNDTGKSRDRQQGTGHAVAENQPLHRYAFIYELNQQTSGEKIKQTFMEGVKNTKKP